MSDLADRTELQRTVQGENLSQARVNQTMVEADLGQLVLQCYFPRVPQKEVEQVNQETRAAQASPDGLASLFWESRA